MSLKTKNVFLTGGAAGLGKTYTDVLLAAGAKVVFGDINADTGKATEQELAAKHGAGNVTFVQFDATNKDQLEAAFQTAVSKLGFVDLVVNNAGYMVESSWEGMIDLNFTALVRSTYIAKEHMRLDKGGKGGRIINISSQFGIETNFTVPVYCGTKQAVRAFTSALAESPDQPAQGIEYASLCPGPADTALIRTLDNTKVYNYDLVKRELELDRQLGTKERIAEGFMLLATQDVMNGAILYAHKLEISFQVVKREAITWPPAPPIEQAAQES